MVKLSNQIADGYVIADSVRAVLIEEHLDSDGDDISDDEELALLNSDPNNAFSQDSTDTLSDADFDTDGDGFANLYEIEADYDPLDIESTPPPSSELNTLDGNVKVNGAILLTPKLTQPFICSETSRGSIYYDDNLQSPMICNGEQWDEFKGIQGERGLKADKGLVGLTGLQGAKGETGDRSHKGLQVLQGRKVRKVRKECRDQKGNLVLQAQGQK